MAAYYPPQPEEYEQMCGASSSWANCFLLATTTRRAGWLRSRSLPCFRKKRSRVCLICTHYPVFLGHALLWRETVSKILILLFTTSFLAPANQRFLDCMEERLILHNLPIIEDKKAYKIKRTNAEALKSLLTFQWVGFILVASYAQATVCKTYS